MPNDGSMTEGTISSTKFSIKLVKLANFFFKKMLIYRERLFEIVLLATGQF